MLLSGPPYPLQNLLPLGLREEFFVPVFDFFPELGNLLFCQAFESRGFVLTDLLASGRRDSTVGFSGDSVWHLEVIALLSWSRRVHRELWWEWCRRWRLRSGEEI
jgi:hypothetical protein